MEGRKLKYIFIALSLVLILTAASSARIAAAEPDSSPLGNAALTPLLSSITGNVNTVGDDQFSTMNLATLDPPPTQHYGPFASGSPDSGTCGNNWAEDTYNRDFSVFFDTSGSIVVVEQFKDGSFVTGAAPGFSGTQPSPGACQTSATPAGMVLSGITGGMHGYFIIPLSPGTVQTSTSPYCDAVGITNTGCTTAIFIDTHFSCTYGMTCTVTTYFFHYTAGDQGLIIHEWKNASPDRGGNNGDIRSFNIP